jgi:iron(III) transport system permease protein
MVFFTVNYLNVAYQSFAILIVTYVALFLPQASGAARGALEQVNPHVEEAARSLGKGPGRTLATVTVPLIRTGLLAGGALVFLTTMKELPATLLLRPTGFDTLAVEIWSAASEGIFSQAAVPALLLLAVSAVPMYLLVTRIYES